MKRAALLLYALAGLAACDKLPEPSKPIVAGPSLQAAAQGPSCLATGELATGDLGGWTSSPVQSRRSRTSSP